ncbi:MAG: transketolase C-terminal domain-containing protein, partial [Flavobacteriaceae bacterium]
VKKGTAKDENIFECLNFDYSGPIDGHDLSTLISELERLKKVKGPKLLHITTTKGKGLKKAEENQVIYHAPGRFNAITGELLKAPVREHPPKYQDVFGHTLVELARDNKGIIGITPAMPTGSSMKFMMEVFPDRAFDVGIAEQHAVTLAAGMATDGLVPFCNIYSTFMQRAYDQLIHDVALQNLPVIFCLDRAGIVGRDGATHHGVFDLAYLRCIPNMAICAPMNEMELRNIMYTAQLGLPHPIAIRYPRGRATTTHWKNPFVKMDIGKGIELKKGHKIAVLSIGHIGNTMAKMIGELPQNSAVGHYNMRFVKPLDKQLLRRVFAQHEHIVTIEDGCTTGGFGSAVLEYANEVSATCSFKIFGIPDSFVGHGNTEQLHQVAQIDPISIKNHLYKLI